MDNEGEEGEEGSARERGTVSPVGEYHVLENEKNISRFDVPLFSHLTPASARSIRRCGGTPIRAPTCIRAKNSRRVGGAARSLLAAGKQRRLGLEFNSYGVCAGGAMDGGMEVEVMVMVWTKRARLRLVLVLEAGADSKIKNRLDETTMRDERRPTRISDTPHDSSAL
jgi:hypothetical protein